MSNRRTRSYRLVAIALVAAITASLVPHEAAHAEVADHAAPATTAAAAAVQSDGCEGGVGACSGFSVTILGTTVWCESCDCMWVVVGEDGRKRLVRDHWIDCGLS